MTPYAALSTAALSAVPLSAVAETASGATPGVLVGVGLVVVVFLGWVYRLLTAHGRGTRRSRLDGNDAGPGDAGAPGSGAGSDAGSRD